MDSHGALTVRLWCGYGGTHGAFMVNLWCGYGEPFRSITAMTWACPASLRPVPHWRRC